MACSYTFLVLVLLCARTTKCTSMSVCLYICMYKIMAIHFFQRVLKSATKNAAQACACERLCLCLLCAQKRKTKRPL
ncbi:hypothetical protein EDC01DRAFT_676691 [Geopyxis carbonaria]|nr:hypothetical protein EDC01DRAFT_676691 [Geopyxis carbonaria]